MTMLLASATEQNTSRPKTHPRSTLGVATFDQLESFDGSPEWQAWRRLFRELPDSSLRQYPDFVRHQMNEFLPTDKLPVCVAQNSGDDETAAVGILMPYRIRFNEAIAGLTGPGTEIHGYRLAGGRVLSQHAASEKSVFEAALQTAQSTKAQFVLVEDVIRGSPMDSLIRDSLHTDWHCFVPSVESRWGIRMNMTRDDYWQSISKNTRKKIKQRSRKLEDSEVRFVTDVDQIPDFVSDVLRVTEASWKSRQDDDVIDEEELTQRLTHLASQGMLRAWSLMLNDRPIAFDITAGLNGRMEGMECAYDEKLAHLSPGMVLLSRTIDDLFGMDDVDFYDFGHGDMDYKARLSNDCRKSYHAILMPPGIRSTALLGAIRTARFTFNSTRTIADRLGIKTWLKKLL